MAQEKAEVATGRENRILVLDANILLRAVLGKRVRVLIERYAQEVPLFIPSACVAEVHEYLPALCARRGWDVARALDLLESLLSLMKVVESGFYADFEEPAKHRIGARDLDDWPLVALALALGANVWTEDTDFFGSGLPTWTTDTVEIYLNDDPLRVNESIAPYDVTTTTGRSGDQPLRTGTENLPG